MPHLIWTLCAAGASSVTGLEVSKGLFIFAQQSNNLKGGSGMQNDFSKIEELKRRLLDLGYHTYQIESIIKEATGKVDSYLTNPAQAACVIEALQDYLSFALKCKASSQK